MKVALYERVSSEEQVLHGDSLEAQDNALHEFAKTHGHEVVKVYRDEGISAHKPYTARPELLKLLRDIEAGKIELVLFVKLDRWFRNVKEYYKVQEILERNKVCWQAILEDYETLTANGRFTVTIMLAIAQQEAERTGERIKFVQVNKLKNKQPITGNYGFGYTTAVVDGKKTVIKADEEATNAMFDQFFKLQNIAAVADYMADTYGIVAAQHTWSRRLRNLNYTGMAHGIPDFIPAYITMEQHEKIMRIIESRRTRRTNNRSYIFSGIAKCPVCGGSMSGGTHIFNGKEVPNYRCGRSWNKGGCSMRKITQENIVEKILLERIKIQAQLQIDEQHKEQKKESPKKYESQLARLNDMYLMGNIDKSSYESKTKELKQKISRIKLENQEKDPQLLQQIIDTDFERLYQNLDREAKKIFWRNILDVIYINGRDISFQFAI